MKARAAESTSSSPTSPSSQTLGDREVRAARPQGRFIVPPSQNDLDHIYKIIRKTGRPEVVYDLSWNKPNPKSEFRLYLPKIEVDRKLRPGGELIVCPFCSGSSPKCLGFYLIWCSDGYLRIVGHICGRRFLGSRRFSLLQADAKRALDRESNEAFLLDVLPIIHLAISDAVALVAASVALQNEKRRFNFSDQDSLLLAAISVLGGIEGAILVAAILSGLDKGGGPLTPGFAGWLYDYQTLLGGGAALIAAILALAGQIWLHHKALRDSQINGANSFILELTTRAVALAAKLRESKSAAEAPDRAYLAVKLNGLIREIDRAEKFLDASPTLFAGPSQHTLAASKWRLVTFETALNNCREALEIFQSEMTGGCLSFSDYSILEEVASDLSDVATAPLPPFIEAIK